MKKAIHEVAADILEEFQKPMSADEMYDIIVTRNLYEFKAKSPHSVLRSQLRRHSANVTGPNQAKDLKFYMSEDGRFRLV